MVTVIDTFVFCATVPMHGPLTASGPLPMHGFVFYLSKCLKVDLEIDFDTVKLWTLTRVTN